MTKPQLTKDLFVADIAYTVTETELKQLFSLCGTVRLIQLLKTPQGDSKGIAFIRMGNDRETREAVNMLDGTLMHDRCISVSIARSKAERAAATTGAENQGQKPRRRRTPKGRKKLR
jgi:RNA recognition motif-containing protein